jgi:hypothetical protein
MPEKVSMIELISQYDLVFAIRYYNQLTPITA